MIKRITAKLCLYLYSRCKNLIYSLDIVSPLASLHMSGLTISKTEKKKKINEPVLCERGWGMGREDGSGSFPLWARKKFDVFSHYITKNEHDCCVKQIKHKK